MRFQTVMLEGERISLRPVVEADMDAMCAANVAISNRGSYFPLGVQSEPVFRRSFAEHGFWQREEGTLLIITPEGEMAGHIEFFKPVSYWDAFELSYSSTTTSSPAAAMRPRRSSSWSTTCSRGRSSIASIS